MALAPSSYFSFNRSAVTNLSFYGGSSSSCEEKGGEDGASHIFAAYRTLCGSLMNVLLHDNEEAVAEAARAFGNFSRDPEVAPSII